MISTILISALLAVAFNVLALKWGLVKLYQLYRPAWLPYSCLFCFFFWLNLAILLCWFLFLYNDFSFQGLAEIPAFALAGSVLSLLINRYK